MAKRKHPPGGRTMKKEKRVERRRTTSLAGERFDQSKIAKRIIDRMESHGLSQKALAKKMGMGGSMLSRRLSGDVSFTLYELDRAAEALDSPKDSLWPIAGDGASVQSELRSLRADLEELKSEKDRGPVSRSS